MSVPCEPDERDYYLRVFTAPAERCRVCGRDATISQWRGRHVERLSGYHLLIMRDRRCPDLACPGRAEIMRAADEHRFALKKDVLGLDVLFLIADMRLEQDLSFEEIARRLAARGVPSSLSGVCAAFRRFVALTSCRGGESEAVRQKLREQGGAVVLIDGVQYDDRSAVLYLVVDAVSRTPLFAQRHPVRSEVALSALLERLKAMDVPIRAFVTDMEKGLVPAIRAVFPEVPHQFCQLHFLKRCAAALDKPLSALGAEVDRAAEKLRKIRRQLQSAPEPTTQVEAHERELADGLLVQAHAASKRAGRPPFKPPALVRHEQLGEVAQAAEEIADHLRGGALVGKDHIGPQANGEAHGAGQRAAGQRGRAVRRARQALRPRR